MQIGFDRGSSPPNSLTLQSAFARAIALSLDSKNSNIPSHDNSRCPSSITRVLTAKLLENVLRPTHNILQ